MNLPALLQFPNTDDQPPLGRIAYSPIQGKRVDPVYRRMFVPILADIFLTSIGGLLAFKISLLFRISHSLIVMQDRFRHVEGLANTHVGFFLLYVALLVLAAHSQNLYRSSPARSARLDNFLAMRAVGIAALVLTGFIYLSGGMSAVSRVFVGLTVLFSIIALTSWRACGAYFRRKQLERGLGLRHTLIVGAGRVGQILASQLEHNPVLGYKVMGFIDSNHHEDPRILGKVEEFVQVVRQEFIDEVFITIPSERELVKTVALEASQLNLGLKIVSEQYDGLLRFSQEEFVGGFAVRELQATPMPGVGLVIKRTIDIIAAAFGLILLSPFLALIALAVKIDSPGPILYRASRVGKKSRRFVCYKFRTMVTGADEQKKILQHLNERVGPLFKITKDPRVTRLGAFLRKHSIDELPQLWNVLKADMSLVGPRPPEFDELMQYKLEHLRRLDATPGITGLWQVSARHDPRFETAVAFDNQYMENWSLILDFKILLKTIPVVLKGLGR
jgi:exopolysaccharide biosynthesis polyprenyl glycosylphosphotransferase